MKFNIDQLFIIRDAIEKTGTRLTLSQIDTAFKDLRFADYDAFVVLWKKTEWCKKCNLFVNGTCKSNRDCLDGKEFEWEENEIEKIDHLNAPVKYKEIYIKKPLDK